jgi:hypothetical protein
VKKLTPRALIVTRHSFRWAKSDELVTTLLLWLPLHELWDWNTTLCICKCYCSV